MNSVLEIDSVLFESGHRQILTDIYLKCERGEVVGLLGRNGTGKSCLLKIIFGTLKATNASVRYNSLPQTQFYQKASLIKYLPQHSMSLSFLSVAHFINLFVPKKNQDALYEKLNKDSLQKKKMGQLSSGQIRYIETLAIIYSKTEFVLLDEPFSYLAPIHVEQIKKAIRAVSPNKGIIITDHQYTQIMEVAERLYCLQDGRNHAVSSLKELEYLGYVNPAIE